MPLRWQKTNGRTAIKYLLAGVFVATLFWYFKPHTPMHIENQARVEAKSTSIVKAVRSSKPATTTSKAPIGVTKQSAQSHAGTISKQTLPASTPKPKPETVATTYASGCKTYDALFRSYTWDVRVAEAICEAESSGDPYQLSATCDRGLMQINCVHADMVGGNLSKLYNPATNIAVAWKIYSAEGWSPWTTYDTGAYVQFL